MKLSEWQKGNTYPQEIGIYQRQQRTFLPQSNVIYSYFDGLTWRHGYSTKEEAFNRRQESNLGCLQDRLDWRGVIEE